MEGIFSRIEELKVIPVIKINDAKDAPALTQALIDGGLPCAEVTLRTDAAVESIRRISERGELLVGAGTVLTVEQTKQALSAGAQFIVSPGFSHAVVRYCIDNKIPVIPGTATATDIQAAYELGLKVVKFFPAEAAGGVKTLKAISAPFDMMRFIPTGGINAGNLKDYLKLPSVIACGGRWIVKQELISTGRFDEVTRLVSEAVAICDSSR